jgi:two-component system, chemotaxis family, protein-glutamate methylesterase/glutaminase
MEAQQFVRLLARSLKGDADVRGAVNEDVRRGPFAGASDREAALVFAVWRRALEAIFASEADAGRRALALTALDRLQVDVRRRATAWAARRVDLVVVAASAGGLPALERLLAPLEPDLPVSVVIVLHVSPNAPSLVANILARKARLRVAAAVNGGTLQLGTAYVAPPGHHLAVTQRRTRLVDSPEILRLRPAADVLFASAADAFGGRVASVVLSGTGSDGALGTRAVRDQGGITFAQDPDSAQFGGMPAAAIDTGAVQHVLPLDELPAALQLAIARGRGDDVHA